MDGLLPAAVAVVEHVGPRPPADCLPAEMSALGRASDGRLREFATARRCARMALDCLGLPGVAIGRGPDREPLWPSDVVGSITHCDGYVGAAVARRDHMASVGIDAEPAEPLPEGVLEQVARPEERACLRRMAGTVPWDRVLFSAKESVFKAWFPLTRCWLGFHDARLSFEPTAGRFTADVLVPTPHVDGVRVDHFSGLFRVDHGLVVTAVAVPLQ
ncbi:MAG: 4'-phosphopantetheinyl transferase superfamily protein [Actinobacteria bacterium]|nr:4'-phosphopantetheinyl transferase superfamily protein [Actinomycetota bacterium]